MSVRNRTKDGMAVVFFDSRRLKMTFSSEELRKRVQSRVRSGRMPRLAQVSGGITAKNTLNKMVLMTPGVSV
jgi:hypothetical protein